MTLRCLLIFFAMSVSSATAQDTILLDSKHVEVKDPADMIYYSVITRDSTDSNKVRVRTYYASDQLKAVQYYSDYSAEILDGEYRQWFPTGQLASIITYKQGKIDGKFQMYWDNGQLKRDDAYKDGELVSGSLYGKDGSPETYYAFNIIPVFPGGNAALQKFIKINTRYPKAARRKRVSGTVHVKFQIAIDGTVTNPVIARSDSELLNEEALRIVKSLPKFTPGYQDGKPVPVMMNFPFVFSLK